MPRPEQQVEESTTGSNGSEKKPAVMNGWPKSTTQADDEPAVDGLQCGSVVEPRWHTERPAGARLRSARRQTARYLPPPISFWSGASLGIEPVRSAAAARPMLRHGPKLQSACRCAKYQPSLPVEATAPLTVGPTLPRP